MISLKKYLDANPAGTLAPDETSEQDIAVTVLAAYRSALREMGSCSLDACPALGGQLSQVLGRLEAKLSPTIGRDTVEATERKVQQQLQDWGKRAAEHSRQQAGEVKNLLIVMARTAESVGERDQRCASQINAVTTRLERIASLEDLTLIRASIEKSAAELKTSIDRMTAEGNAAVEELRAQVSGYQARLEEAEQIASRDALTGLGSRQWVEDHIERRCSAGVPLCVAILDIDGFKQVNDDHGHLVGDELLKQFAAELQSACRTTDMLGRWGGDEFILLLDCDRSKARAKIDRLREWVCGNYTVQGPSGPIKLRVDASIGLAEHRPRETMKELLARADAEMYKEKAASRAAAATSRA
ncbi:MAG: GGDEF domain-containing protein [Terracidiphilus sp.]|jgi:diguanylate cyclase (GGDEF)-like protein